MPFPAFGQKIKTVKEFSIEEIPLFSVLTPSEQKLVEKKARLAEYKRGDLVYAESTPADAFYVVISGRFRLFTPGREGRPEETLLCFCRGDYFGETSLLTGQAHSASVEARSDGLVLKLAKEDFLKFMREIPVIARHLSRTLGHRLTRRLGEEGRGRKVKIAAYYPVRFSDREFRFLADLAAGVVRETGSKTVLVDFSSQQPASFPEYFKRNCPPPLDFREAEVFHEADLKPYAAEAKQGYQYLRLAPVASFGERDERKISALVTFLTYRFDYLLLRLDPASPATARALKQSDSVYLYGDGSPEALKANLQQCAELKHDFGFRHDEIRLLLADDGTGDVLWPEMSGEQDSPRITLLPDAVNYPARYQSALRFLSRELAEILIGLALGSGAAYGLSQIGVLRVLEREGIPVDVIAGSSIGALIGGLWGAGYGADEIENMARSIRGPQAFLKLIGFRDIAIGHLGLLKGDKITEFLKTYLGDRTFQDLKIPVKMTAVDFQTAQEIVFEKGRVLDAVRASISIPGVFRPVPYKGSYLIDGGVIDPLPVRVLTKMGVKKIIAVNVLPGPVHWQDLRGRQREAQRLRAGRGGRDPWTKIAGGVLDRFRDRYAANMINVLMNTILFMEYELAAAAARRSDILIHPIAAQGHWAEFYSPEKFIQTGEEKAREQLEEIKRLVRE